MDHDFIFAEEQKGCRKKHHGCKEQLIIDSVIMKQAYVGHQNVHSAFLDYMKAFDSTAHSWLVEVLQIYKIHPALVEFLKTTMTHWRTSLQVNMNNKSVKTDEIPIRRGIF
ncbi:hypothetical protein HHI36_023228 [Cryptolaemus montrouzieri]|uniref:Reverse transcriptase domain-containing protein n=1 Tax=Cryptolaemus montrouzieri TaxID=559131 RepID=A0ABD2PFU0_9CUCU